MSPEKPLFFAKVKSRDYNTVNIPFRFKNDPTRKIKCIYLNRGSYKMRALCLVQSTCSEAEDERTIARADFSNLV